KTAFDGERLRGVKLAHDLVDAKTGKAVVEAGSKITPRKARQLADEGLKDVLVQADELIGKYVAEDIFDAKTGQVALEAGEEITKETLETLETMSVTDLPVLAIDHINTGSYIRDTLMIDK